MKKNLIFAIFLMIILVSSITSLIKRKAKDRISNKEVFIEYCILDLESLNLTKEIELNICNCTHNYLFDKYGGEIYKEEFVVPNRIDSLTIIECMLKELDADTLNSEDVLKQLQNK
jgi:hypothetical protein